MVGGPDLCGTYIVDQSDPGVEALIVAVLGRSEGRRDVAGFCRTVDVNKSLHDFCCYMPELEGLLGCHLYYWVWWLVSHSHHVLYSAWA